MTMYSRAIVKSSVEACEKSQELLSRGAIVRRDSESLIRASLKIIGRFDDFMGECSNQDESSA